MTLAERILTGAPLRLGEFSEYIGYSKEEIRKWMDKGRIQFVQAPGSVERRIPVSEAERYGRILKII